jgi:hypothetical protein
LKRGAVRRLHVLHARDSGAVTRSEDVVVLRIHAFDAEVVGRLFEELVRVGLVLGAGALELRVVMADVGVRVVFATAEAQQARALRSVP